MSSPLLRSLAEEWAEKDRQMLKERNNPMNARADHDRGLDLR